MKHNLTKAIMIGAFLVGITGIKAAPQAGDEEGWYRTRDSFYQTEGWRMRLFDRVRMDVDRVQSVAFTGGDEYRISRTKEELNDLQTKISAGKYDEPELDSVIGALGKVVADNRLSARDRDILTDDLTRMRDYRAHHEN